VGAPHQARAGGIEDEVQAPPLGDLAKTPRRLPRSSPRGQPECGGKEQEAGEAEDSSSPKDRDRRRRRNVLGQERERQRQARGERSLPAKKNHAGDQKSDAERIDVTLPGDLEDRQRMKGVERAGEGSARAPSPKQQGAQRQGGGGKKRLQKREPVSPAEETKDGLRSRRIDRTETAVRDSGAQIA